MGNPMALTSTEKQKRFQRRQRKLGRKELRSQYLDAEETRQVMEFIQKLKRKRAPEE
jgi:hypothetical protein